MTVTSQASGSNGAGGRHAAEPSLGELVNESIGSLQRIVHGEIELAKLELRNTVKNGGAGIGLFGAAAVLLAYSLTFGLIALAEGLITLGIWRWAAFLIVFGLLLVLVLICVLIGLRKVKRVRAPERTIETSKETVAYLKANVKTPPKAG